MARPWHPNERMRKDFGEMTCVHWDSLGDICKVNQDYRVKKPAGVYAGKASRSRSPVPLPLHQRPTHFQPLRTHQ